MPRKTDIYAESKRSRQRRGRRRESLRAQGHLSNSGHPGDQRGRSLSRSDDVSGGSDVSLEARGRRRQRGHRREDHSYAQNDHGE